MSDKNTDKGYWSEFKPAPSTYEQLKYGFQAMTEFTEAAGMLAQRTFRDAPEWLQGRIEVNSHPEFGFQVEYVPPSEELKSALKGEVSPVVDEWQEFRTKVPDALRDVQVKERNVRLEKDNPRVAGTSFENSAKSTVGKVLGALADVSTAVPIAQGVKGAAATSAAIAVTDVYTYEKALYGEVDPKHIAIAAVLGSVFGAGISKGSQKFREWITSRVDDNIPITPDALEEQLVKHEIKPSVEVDQKAVFRDAVLLAKELNKRLGIKGVDIKKPISKKAHAKKGKELRKVFKEESREADYLYWRARNIDEVRDIDANVFARQADEAEILKRAQQEEMWVVREKELSDEALNAQYNVRQAARAKINKDANTQLSLADIPPPIEVQTAMARGIEKAQWNRELQLLQLTEREKAKRLSSAVTNQELSDIIKDPKTTSRASQLKTTRSSSIVTNNEIQDILANPANIASKSQLRTTAVQALDDLGQSGRVSQDLLTHLASSTSGAAVGYWWDGEEGALMGAVLGLAAPWTMSRLYNKMGTLYNRTHETILNSASRPVVSPKIRMEALGPAGKVFMKKYQRAIQDTDLAIAHNITRIKRAINTFNKDDKATYIAGMRGDIPINKLPIDIAKAVTTTKKHLRKTLSDSHDVGVLSSKKIITLLADDKYWPRVWNEAFLATKQGREAWINLFSGKGWTLESLEKTLKSILGEKSRGVSNVINMAERKGGYYYISRQHALDLLEQRGKTVIKNRSTHLEHKRKIHVKEEKVLDQFLVNDPEAVLTSYFHDAYRRISFAREFGADDSIAMELAKRLGNDYGTPVQRYVEDLYFTAVGSDRSSYIAQAINMNEGLKRAYGSINAFETLKLTFAQTINSTQAYINGTTLLAKNIGFFNAHRKGIEAIFKSLGKEGKEFAAETGAAIETTILQTIGEFSEARSIFRKEFTGMARPFEYINNPSKFLTATGFIDVELFQRKLAANMGKQYAEHLLKKKAMIDAGVLKGAKAQKVLAQMDELGLPTNVAADAVAEGDMLRAGLIFSNEVNFRNTPDMLPLGWNSPHAKIYTKFKSFAFHHGRFVRDNAIKPALQDGNIVPLFNYLLVGTPIGMTIDEFRRMIKGDDSELTMTKRFVRGFSSVGGLGILFDSAMSAAYSSGAFLSAVAGPAWSDAAKVTTGAMQSGLKWDIKPVTRSLVNTQVFPGKKIILEDLKSDLNNKKRIRRSRRKKRQTR